MKEKYVNNKESRTTKMFNNMDGEAR